MTEAHKNIVNAFFLSLLEEVSSVLRIEQNVLKIGLNIPKVLLDSGDKMTNSVKKDVAIITIVLLSSVAATFGLKMLTSPIFESLFDSAIKWKFEPWLWDKLQQLEANGTIRSMSIIVVVREGSSCDSILQFADFLASMHNAEITGVGTVLSFITIRVMSTEVKKIAAYRFVDLLGDGERTVTFD